MNTHADLLTELTKYKGGEFVPKRSDLYLKFDDPDCDGGYFEWWSNLRMMFLADTHDAHAHIELAAWRAVREWCKQGMWLFSITDRKDGSIHLWSNDIEIGSGGPDDATALLSALRTINGATK